MISAVGQFGGLSGPAVVGWAFHETGSIYVGFTIAALTIFIGIACWRCSPFLTRACASRRGSHQALPGP